MDAAWKPTRKSAGAPSWLRKGGENVYGEQQSEYEAYARRLREAGGEGAAEASPASTSAGTGKGFGGGEATRDPEPTLVDENDPKGKQQAIHHAESFADYLAKRRVDEG